MKTTIFIIALVAIGLAAFNLKNVDYTKNTLSGILFHQGTFNEALQLAKNENKLVFIDIYATWCGPCKSLKKTTFSDSIVGAYYNEHFINVALDGEKGEGLELAKKYAITGYPTLLFINADGVVVSTNAGYRNAKEFIGLGKALQNKRKN